MFVDRFVVEVGLSFDGQRSKHPTVFQHVETWVIHFNPPPKVGKVDELFCCS